MTISAFLVRTGRGIACAARWVAGCTGDLITSLEGKVNSRDVKTVALKVGPRLVALGGAGKAAGVSKAAVALGVIKESLAQEDVFLAAMALVGAIAWSCHETIQRRKAAPNAAIVTLPSDTPAPSSETPTS